MDLEVNEYGITRLLINENVITVIKENVRYKRYRDTIPQLPIGIGAYKLKWTCWQC